MGGGILIHITKIVPQPAVSTEGYHLAIPNASGDARGLRPDVWCMVADVLDFFCIAFHNGTVGIGAIWRSFVALAQHQITLCSSLPYSD